MRAGDILLLLIIAITAVLLVADSVTGGAVGVWIDANGYATSIRIGRMFKMTGMLMVVLLFLPIVMAIWGRFARLPVSTESGLRGAIKTIDFINTAVGDMARWFALALVIVTATVVIQRYVFGNASTQLQESVIYFHSLLFLLSAGATLLANGHVRVDILYSKMTPRAKAWTDLAGVYLALIPMCLLIMVTSGPYVNASWRILEQSRESDGLPLVFMLKTAILAFAVLLLLQGVAMALRAALTISGRTPPVMGRHHEQEL
tara:strand:+ start:201 stop:980 length:780 start_codon:yes stop_codon:yes gene_type:complete